MQSDQVSVPAWKRQLPTLVFIVGLLVIRLLHLPFFLSVGVTLVIVTFLGPTGRSWMPALLSAPLIGLYALLEYGGLSPAAYKSVSILFLGYFVVAIGWLALIFSKSTWELTRFVTRARKATRAVAEGKAKS
jgi:hypothetical protein